MSKDFSRIDRVVSQLEKLRVEANEIIDAYVDYAVCTKPARERSWGTTKLEEIAKPAGSTIDHLAALKLVRNKLNKI